MKISKPHMRPQSILNLILGLAGLALLIAVVLMNLTPPFSRDALIHHLAIPKLWLKHGGFYEIPWAKYSYYPMNVDLLYLLCLYLKNDIAPKFVHFVFGMGTGLLVYLHLKKRLGHGWGLLGGLIFLSTPIIVRLSTSAYVDLGLIFFTTGAVLSFVQWQDTEYRRIRWFILSALSMGLAAGSKYNAMVPWVFLNLVVVYCVAKDTQKQLLALRYGILFFALSLLVVSPWYIKNYLLTSNPVYPLFDNLFNPPTYSGDGDGGGASVGFFQKRELMYGESIWDTLLIPVRMFFEGRDHSAQYFDGVLNPLLVLFIPFSFFKKKHFSDLFLFLTFSLFVLISAFFLASPRVRYILPVIPFLAIATTAGIKAIFDRVQPTKRWIRYTVLFVVLSTVSVFLFANGAYVLTHFSAIRPFSYITGTLTRDEFLARRVGSYRATKCINDVLPEDARVFLMFMAGRGYYLERNYYHENSFGRNTINELVHGAVQSEKDFKERLDSLKSSHILTRKDLLGKYLDDNFTEAEILQFLELVRHYTTPLCDSGGYVVLEIDNSRNRHQSLATVSSVEL